MDELTTAPESHSAPQPHTQDIPPQTHTPSGARIVKKKAPMWAFYVLVALFAAGLVYEFTKESMSMILIAVYIIFGSVIVVNRKLFFAFEKQTHETLANDTQSAPAPIEPVHPPDSTTSPAQHTPIHKGKLVLLGVAALVVLMIGVMVFMPRAYLWVALQVGFPSTYTTDSTVHVSRSLSSLDAEDGSGAYEDSITVNTKASHIAPSTWSFITTLQNDAGTPSTEGVEVLVFEDEAFQRQTGTEDGAFTQYPLQQEEYDTTVQAIEASSLFVPELIDYAGAGRFVFDTGEKPWWYLHYRLPIDVAALEADAPEWYEPQLFPFASESQLGDQDISFLLDVWIHPFTGRIMHEVWNISKSTTSDQQYDIALDIIMVRAYDYGQEVTIDKPQT